ncbi:EH domain-binding protein 1, partial [Trichinella pseudospiralis]
LHCIGTMANLVWRKIQHQNKRSTKFRFAAHFHELAIECSSKWQPSSVRIVWEHRKRRYATKAHSWEPSITNPYSGIIVWPEQDADNLEVITTLYRDPQQGHFDDKEWTFVVEEVKRSGKCKPIASVNVNLRMFASEMRGSITEMKFQLRPLKEALQRCTLQLQLTCAIVGNNALFEERMEKASNDLFQAFDAAALLGVPRLIDPNDMVIMAIPDKISVMTYVYSLRSVLTGSSPIDRNDPLERVSLNREEKNENALEVISTSRRDSMNEEKKSSLSLSPRRRVGSASSSNKAHDSAKEACCPLSFTFSTSSIQKPTLMTRQQLMNPFDSDEENSQVVGDDGREAEVEEPKKVADEHLLQQQQQASSAASVPDISAKLNMKPASREEELRRRVREIVDSFPIQNDDCTTIENSERRQELTARARQLIKQFNNTGDEATVVRLSETLTSSDLTLVTNPGISAMEPKRPDNIHGLHGNNTAMPLQRVQSPSYCCNDSDTSKLTTKTPNSTLTPTSPHLHSPITKESLLMSTASFTPSPSASKMDRVTMLAQDAASESAFARFKRFGSMRGQELAHSIGILSNRVSQTVRSASVVRFGLPRESELPKVSLSNKNLLKSASPANEAEIPTAYQPPMKIITPLDMELQRKSVTEEMEALVEKQKELDHRANEVEKEWRLVMQEAPGTEREKSLMNEYFLLVNERNLLTRREMHLSLLETIRSFEQRFNEVQKELAELINIEECEKTEAHKQRIDMLMEELIAIVNKRDELLQQLMQHDQGTEEDAEIADALLQNNFSVLEDDHKSCVIQ